MNILLVSNEFPPEMATGGIGSYMFHLAQLLHTNGHKVYVISETKTQFTIAEKGFCTNYLISCADAESFRKQALEVFEKYLLDESIDVIESPEVLAPALYIKEKFPHIPLIVKLHTPGVLITRISQTYYPIISKLRFVAGSLIRGKLDLGYWRSTEPKKDSNPEYIICKKAHKILSPSAALKNWVAKYWSLAPEKITVLPNPFAIDESLFAAPTERNTRTICFVGKLTVLKGIIAFTQALKIVLSKYPEYKVLIIGRDEKLNSGLSAKSYMQNELARWKTRVRFLGQLSSTEVNNYLLHVEVSVIPSLWENFPNVILESMAAGAAIVASDIGGIPEIITDGKTGLLFPSRSNKKMARAISRVIDDPKLRTELATNAREKIREMNNNEFQKNILSIYRQVQKESN